MNVFLSVELCLLHFSQRGPRNPCAHSQKPYWPHRPPFKQSKLHKSDATETPQNEELFLQLLEFLLT